MADRLAGMIRLDDGSPVPGPAAPQWKGRNKGRRQDRRWATAWSPEQIAHRLPVDFPENGSMRISAKITTLPHALRQTLTWDRGKELAAHAQLSIDTGVQVYFADPHSPWQRGTNENTNGLLRQYFPKGTDLSRWDSEEIDAVAMALNNRPRKTLNWRTPAEALNEHLLSVQSAGVATTY